MGGQKHAILHTSQTNGEALAPRPLPGYATGYNKELFLSHHKGAHFFDFSL